MVESDHVPKELPVTSLPVKAPLTRWKKGSRAQATGSHVIWNEKPLTRGKKGSQAHRKSRRPLTRWKKGSRAQATGSHVIWKEKPLTSMKKGSWAQVGLKPRRKRGLKVQSPISGTGVILDSKKQHKKF